MAVVAAFGCSRELAIPETPPPPGPGTLAGRVVWQRPGVSLPVAAEGAMFELLASGRSTVADDDGRFRFGDLTDDAGELLVRFDSDGDGAPDRQRLLVLSTLGVGRGHDVSLGELLVAENAAVEGRVRLSDRDGDEGHRGILAFVPQGPFTATTGDDGTFVLDGLPEGGADRGGFTGVVLRCARPVGVQVRDVAG